MIGQVTDRSKAPGIVTTLRGLSSLSGAAPWPSSIALPVPCSLTRLWGGADRPPADARQEDRDLSRVSGPEAEVSPAGYGGRGKVASGEQEVDAEGSLPLPAGSNPAPRTSTFHVKHRLVRAMIRIWTSE